MIDANLVDALGRIEARQRDVAHAFEPGFEPERSDVAGPAGVQPDADPLSVAAPEGAYFVAARPGGDACYSRAGSFALSGGRLETADGRAVLGFSPDRRASLVPLRVDPYDAALGRVAGARLDADGTFGYSRTTVDPRSGERRSERVTVGRIALARFPAGTQPVRIDATHVRAPDGVAPQMGVPGDGGFASLRTRARDLGHVDLIAGLERLREAYEGFDAAGSAYRVRVGLERTATDLLK